MKALVVSQLGNPLSSDAARQPLQLKNDVERPSLQSKQVRIEVAAASINFADVLIVQVRTYLTCALLVYKAVWHEHMQARA